MKYPNLFTIFIFLTCFIPNIFSQTADITRGCAPLSVTFSPPDGMSTFYWEFGDNATSTLSHPQHIYVNAGSYTVNFRENAGGAVVGSFSINVYEKPVLLTAATPNEGCTPLQVSFANQSTLSPAIPITGWQWVFGDGTTPSALVSPNHTYADAGNFTVSLALFSSLESCEVTEVFPDLVSASASPNISFSTSPTPPAACLPPLKVAFNNQSEAPSSLDFEWDFGNGNTSTAVQPSSQNYTQEGQFEVTLTGTNSTGCSTMASTIVSIGNPDSDFIFPDTICLGDTLQPFHSFISGTSYLWEFGPTATIATSTLVRPKVAFTQPGSTTISLTITRGGCSSTTEKEIFVEYADPGFSFTPSFTCQRPFDVVFTPNTSMGVSYEWELFDSLFSNESHPEITFSNTSLSPYDVQKDTVAKWIELTLTTNAGCTFSYLDSVLFFEPTALPRASVVEGCAPLEVNFRDSSILLDEIIEREWHFGTGDILLTTDPNVNFTYNQPGEYQVWLVVENQWGCRDTSFFLPIIVGEELAPDFEVSATEVCPGDTIQLTPTIENDNIDTWHFETDNGRSFHCKDESMPQWSFVTETGPMDVALTVGYNGCFSTITKSDLVEVKGPIARLEYEMDCEQPYQYVFKDSSYSATQVTWFFGDSTQSNVSDPLHVYNTTGDYMVYLEAENPSSGCPASYDSAMVHVRELAASFELDSLLCLGREYNLNALASKHVDNRCWRGYTWFFTHNRPITTHEASIPFAFSVPGPQSLMLEVRDINACKDTAYLDIEVFDITADFEQNIDRLCYPTAVDFTDMSTGDTTLVNWSWDFGNGETSSEPSPEQLYTDGPPEMLNVVLTVVDALGCAAVDSSAISVYQPTSLISTAPSSSICVGDEIFFSATDFTTEGSSLNFLWNFGNNLANTQTASAVFNDFGGQQVLLFIEEIATGCRDTITELIDVQSYPEAAFSSTLDDLDIICHPQNALFQDVSNSIYPLTYQWNFGNGQSSNIATPSTNFIKGTFQTQLIVSTSNGCADTTSQSYTLVGPEGNFALDALELCPEMPITATLSDTIDVSSFVWDFNDGSPLIENTNPVSHTYQNSGQQLVTLVLKGANDACSFPIQHSFNIIEPMAFFVENGQLLEICQGEMLSFNNQSSDANTWLWNFGDGTTSELEHPEHLFQNSGEIIVSLEAIYNPLGCIGTYEETFFIHPLPMPIVMGDTICEAMAASLSIENADENSTYEWSPMDAFTQNQGSSVTTISEIIEPIWVNVTETTAEGCTNTDSVHIFPIPILEGTADSMVVCKDIPLTLEVPENEFYTYTWTAQESLSCIDCEMVEITPTLSQTVIAEIEDIFGLGCAESDFIFDLATIETNVQVPNVFTPNGDQLNDFFNYYVEENIREEMVVSKFEVFNRFGQKVYDNENPTTGWDGTYKGKLSPSDVYVFIIEVSFQECFSQKFVGDVTLIR